MLKDDNSIPADLRARLAANVGEDMIALIDPSPTPLTTEQRLHELYLILHRVAWGRTTPGNKPLAGGVEKFTQLVLTNRHGVTREQPLPPPTCPHCGQPVPCEAARATGTTEDAVP